MVHRAPSPHNMDATGTLALILKDSKAQLSRLCIYSF